MIYNPNPIDVSGIKLSDEIPSLREMLARNAHEIWALQRLSEGWRYGPTRNDARKEHPSLVPYEVLSESEKNYDRNAGDGNGEDDRCLRLSDRKSLTPQPSGSSKNGTKGVGHE